MASTVLNLDDLTSRKLGSFEYSYTERDLMLYALGLGCHGEEHLRYVFERHPAFSALPTFGVIPAFPVTRSVPMAHYLPKYKQLNALHGEHYLELLNPLPRSARLVTKPQLIDIQDKGSGAVAILQSVTVDAVTNQSIAINEFTTFVKGAGGFKTTGRPQGRRPGAEAQHKAPARPPDVVLQHKTTADQAVLYRLSGDYNPLHIDPAAAQEVGFSQPILHGLCTFGISARLVLQAFAGDEPSRFKSIKVRFSRHVFPGETLQVEMWAEGQDTVVFQTRVVERDVLAISSAAVQLRSAAAAGAGSSVGQSQQEVRSRM